MVLNFTKSDRGTWVAYATVLNTFNLRLVRSDNWALLQISVSTGESSNDKDIIFSKDVGKVFDRDIPIMVTPKYVMIESFSEVISGKLLERTSPSPDPGGIWLFDDGSPILWNNSDTIQV